MLEPSLYIGDQPYLKGHCAAGHSHGPRSFFAERITHIMMGFNYDPRTISQVLFYQSRSFVLPFRRELLNRHLMYFNPHCVTIRCKLLSSFGKVTLCVRLPQRPYSIQKKENIVGCTACLPVCLSLVKRNIFSFARLCVMKNTIVQPNLFIYLFGTSTKCVRISYCITFSES